MIKIVDYVDKVIPIVEIDISEPFLGVINGDTERVESMIERLMMDDLIQRRIVVSHLPNGEKISTMRSRSLAQAKSQIPYQFIFGYILNIDFGTKKVYVRMSNLAKYLTENEFFMNTGCVNNWFTFGSFREGSADIIAIIIDWKDDSNDNG